MKPKGAFRVAATALTITTAVSYAKARADFSTEIRAERPAVRAALSPRAIVSRYCRNCHNENDLAGDLSFEALDIENVGKDPASWEKAVRKLRVRAMPPHGDDIIRPDEREYTALLTYLESSLDAYAAKHPDPGPARNLPPAQSDGIPERRARPPGARDRRGRRMLPGDDASHGFDNVNVGELSPTLLDRYSRRCPKGRAAWRSARRSQACGGQRRPAARSDAERPDRRGVTARHARRHHRSAYVFPQDGEYEFQIRLTRDRDDRIEGLAEPHQIELTVDGARLQLFDLPALTTAQAQSAAYADKEGDAGCASAAARSRSRRARTPSPSPS